MVSAVEWPVFPKTEVVIKLSGKTFSLKANISACSLKSYHSESKLPWLPSVEALFIWVCFFLLLPFSVGTISCLLERGQNSFICLRYLSQISLHLSVFQAFQVLFSFGWIYWIDYFIITLSGYYGVAPNHYHCKYIQASTCTSEVLVQSLFISIDFFVFKSNVQSKYIQVCISSGHFEEISIICISVLLLFARYYTNK